MKRIRVNKKATLITAAIAIPAILAAIIIPKAVKAAKYKKYTTV